MNLFIQFIIGFLVGFLTNFVTFKVCLYEFRRSLRYEIYNIFKEEEDLE